MKAMARLLAVSIAIGGFAWVKAEAETTTITTTTESYVLPTSGSYIVVDPTTGISRGVLDPVTRLVNGQPLSGGVYVVEQGSGKVLATVDSSGTLISLRTVPAALPERFLVVNGQIVYLESDYALRRAQLEQRIDAEYVAGHLSNEQVRRLKQDISEITALDTKRKSDGRLKESVRKEIEQKFAKVQSEFSQDVAEISSKRAKMGISSN